MKIYKNASLKKFNTFNVDEKADFIYEVDKITDISKILSNKKDEILILGGGSNILFTKSFNGTIINLKNKGIRIIEEDQRTALVEISSGENWNDFVLWTIKNDLGGVENLSLIPGNVGAAPIQNIGAYGVEIEDVFHSCKGIMLNSLNEVEINKQDCGFSYRNSIFKTKLKDKIVITSIKLILSKSRHNFNIGYKDLKLKLSNSELSLKKISDEVISIRKSKLPDPKHFGNCGSFFKNPVVNISKFESLQEIYPSIPSFKIDSNSVKIPAAWLIDKSGFKNQKHDNVCVYENQPLVIINNGNASGLEILKFANKIKDTIYSNYNIKLEEEVIIM